MLLKEDSSCLVQQSIQHKSFLLKIKKETTIDVSKKPEPGDDFKIRENHKLMVERAHGDYY